MVDERAIPPAGRIGETEDLIGSVFVKEGKVGTLTALISLDSVEQRKKICERGADA
jgi:hypothetical protein